MNLSYLDLSAKNSLWSRAQLFKISHHILLMNLLSNWIFQEFKYLGSVVTFSHSEPSKAMEMGISRVLYTLFSLICLGLTIIHQINSPGMGKQRIYPILWEIMLINNIMPFERSLIASLNKNITPWQSH